ncbi:MULTISPECIES: site-2 protease family protein [unclassified Marinovum]
MFHKDTPIAQYRGPFGVPVQIGASSIVLVMIYLSFFNSLTDLAYDLAFVVLLVLSILLHELGHAWGCIIQGVPVRRILLHCGGGLCERDQDVTDRQKELIVAMGPIVNLTIWAVSSLIWPHLPAGVLAWALSTLAWINFYLAIFNLMPVQPLDGGKLLNLLLARFLGASAASRIAGWVGLALILAWAPLLIGGFYYFSIMLFFLPSFRANFDMARGTA